MSKLRDKITRKIRLKRMNKLASPDYSDSLREIAATMNMDIVVSTIRRVRETFDESRCIMTYTEDVILSYEEESENDETEYLEYTDSEEHKSTQDLADDYNRIYCEIYTMIADALIESRRGEMIRALPKKQIKNLSMSTMRKGLRAIQSNPICDNKIKTGIFGDFEENAESVWAEDILDLEMFLDRIWEGGRYPAMGNYDEKLPGAPNIDLNYNCPRKLA